MGHTMVIIKALYGLPTSGKMWAEKILAILRTEGWEPSRADDRIWMRRIDDHYEYIGVYVDDLIVAAYQSIADRRRRSANSVTRRGFRRARDLAGRHQARHADAAG